jgi:hypothetical protein
MQPYGRGQMLGSGINPESFKQDFSGFARAAEIQAQGMANLGASIGGVIKDFGEAKKEQKKVDAYNKASAKSIEAAMTLADSYEIGGAKETLSPFLEAYNDPNLSPIEKAALLDQGKAMIPNVFGRYDAKQADEIQRAQFMARGASSPRSVNLQQGEITEVIDGVQYKVPTTFNPSTGEMRRLDGSVVGAANQSAIAIDAGLGFDLPTAGQTAIPEIGGYPDYGSFNEAMVLPERVDPAAIAAAAELTGEQSDVSNVSPMPMETSIPPGAVPIQAETTEIRALTEPEKQEMKLPAGDYVGRFINGKLTATPTIIPAKTDSIASSRTQAMDAPNIALVQKAQESAQKLPSLEAALDLLDSNEVKTGTFADYKVIAKRFLGQDVSNEEQFNSLVGNLAMEAIDLTKGAISDKEMKYFTEVLAPNIGKSVQGNKNIIEFKINAAKRDIEIAKRVSKLFESNASPSEIQSEVLKMMEKKPLDKGMKNPRIGSIGLTPDEMQFLESRPY